jgi:hypothetical protein
MNLLIFADNLHVSARKTTDDIQDFKLISNSFLYFGQL